MTIINSCCVCISLRSGCFIIGIFTLVYHTAVVAGGSFYVHDSISLALLILSSVVIILSIFCVIASVFLIVGLCVESRKLLIPWIGIVSITTFMDIIFANVVFFFKKELNSNDRKEDVEEESPIIYTIDNLVVILNIYSIVCVLSQYQDYCAGRGTAEYNFKNPPKYKLKNILCCSQWCLYLFPFWTSSSSLTSLNPQVAYSSQTGLDKNRKWKIESSESKCHLMIPRLSLNTEMSSGTSFEDVSNASVRSSLTNTIDYQHKNSDRNEDKDEINDNLRCDQIVVQVENDSNSDMEFAEKNAIYNCGFVYDLNK